MGYYINPPDTAKEEFLQVHGRAIARTQAASHDFSGPDLPVCLMDNGAFTAAGIAYCKEEVTEFLQEDGRRRSWWLVSREKLSPYYQEEKTA